MVLRVLGHQVAEVGHQLEVQGILAADADFLEVKLRLALVDLLVHSEGQRVGVFTVEQPDAVVLAETFNAVQAGALGVFIIYEK